MTTVSLRFEDSMKKELDDLCFEMGMNLPTFFMIYAKRVLHDRAIPFEVKAVNDPFYSEENMSALRRAVQQGKSGAVVSKTMEELEAMANG